MYTNVNGVLWGGVVYSHMLWPWVRKLHCIPSLTLFSTVLLSDLQFCIFFKLLPQIDSSITFFFLIASPHLNLPTQLPLSLFTVISWISFLCSGFSFHFSEVHPVVFSLAENKFGLHMPLFRSNTIGFRYKIVG